MTATHRTKRRTAASTDSTRASTSPPYDGSYDLADPQSLNRYAYTQTDPVNFIDPSGLN